jgi:uncharacterized protein YidB (DUF937 family)
MEEAMGLLENISAALSGKGDLNSLFQALNVNVEDKSSLSGFMTSVTGQQGSAGLNSLTQRFNQAGLAETMQSWVGTGKNQPVSPDAVSRALGADRIAAFAQRFGMSPEQASQALAKILPDAVDKMTPNGRIESF